MAARDHRDDGDGRARAWPSSGAPWPATATTWSSSGQLAVRRSDRVAQELRRVLLARTEVRVDELVAGEEFTTAVKALAAGELDPYEAADGLLAG